MSTVGYNAYYTLPNTSTQWKIDMARLDLGERLAVERALSDPASTEFWNVLQVVQANNPEAFQEVKNGSGPLPAPAMTAGWYFDPASVDINFLIGLVVDLMIEIGSSMSKQSMADAHADIAEYRSQADKRLQEELQAAKSEFAGAIAGAILGGVTAAVGAIGGGIGMKHAKSDFNKADDLGKTKMGLTEQKQAYEKTAQSLDLQSQKFSAKAQENKFNADNASRKAEEADAEADVKDQELAELNKKQTARALSKDDEDKLSAAELKQWKQESARLEADITRKTDESLQLRGKAESLRKEAKDQQQLAAENTKYAHQLDLVAKGVRLDATRLEIDVKLTQVGVDEKKLDMATQKHANYVRLLSVVAPGFTSVGQFISAFFNLDAKSQTAYANFISSEMELTQMLKGIEDDIAQKFREFVSQAIQFQKAIDESNNQTMANIAHNV